MDPCRISLGNIMHFVPLGTVGFIAFRSFCGGSGGTSRPGGSSAVVRPLPKKLSKSQKASIFWPQHDSFWTFSGPDVQKWEGGLRGG